ncbi:DUF2326 domain-containing protein [Roseiconus lacunae]|uniref:DUF2326 domain-containing protein n=1 Tax=Roseiconus lacunae TaxID=2605694 RepID=UPI001E5FED5E|nr:DUF2326 domain-containing protein [Roseiconus lacunae]MCD0458617.1 DUF2326 domain-containing protein [Roseiconus lacunae]
MRLSRLYCNRPSLFGPINFRPGLNVVLGEIRLPANDQRSTHNLGKTTLAKVIDFCLCLKRNKNFFLFKHGQFLPFVFYIELETLSGGYVTVRRSVETASKIDIITHDLPNQDFTNDESAAWDHTEVPFDRGKQILDGILGLSAIKPWDFRLPVGYALRTQNDFQDVFQLAKFKGKHKDWKPYVSHILGFDSELVTANYLAAEQIEELGKKIATLKTELGAAEIDLDQIRGLIDIKQREVSKLGDAIKEFDFAFQDSEVNRDLVEQLDQTISQLNGQRYVLSRTQKRIMDSLGAERVTFRTEVAKKLYEEAGIVFPGQLAKQFDDLIRFNKEISEERIVYLQQELANINQELSTVATKLATLNEQRQAQLRFLGDSESISKYRKMNAQMVEMQSELESLRRQSEALKGIRTREKHLRDLERNREDLVEKLEADIESKGSEKESRYSNIRSRLAALSQRFIGHKALVATRINKEKNIEFHAEYLDPANQPTSEDEGKSYKQVLCAAYDLAVASQLLSEEFVRFLYHDGLLEGLDNRIKLNILETLREFGDLGVQQILTVIDSDLPTLPDGTKFMFDPEEVILHLHDEGPQGRLFRFEAW